MLSLLSVGHKERNAVMLERFNTMPEQNFFFFFLKKVKTKFSIY